MEGKMMPESEEANWFEKFTKFMDQNIRGVQYGVYTVAVVGLTVALRSVRPFKKFTRPQDIPSSFIEKHLCLNGKVTALQPAIGSIPPLILVDHYPIISLRWIRPAASSLPVHISSVDISSNGLTWLQHIVVGSHIKFTVLRTSREFASCIVTNKKSFPFQKKNVGLDLVSLGFGTVSALDFNLEKDPLYLKYYRELLVAENRAEKRGSGVWAKEKSNSSHLMLKIPAAVGTAAVTGAKLLVTKLILKNSLPTSGKV